MNLHTDPGWWLVWLLLGVLLTITVETIVDHIRWRQRNRAWSPVRTSEHTVPLIQVGWGWGYGKTRWYKPREAQRRLDEVHRRTR